MSHQGALALAGLTVVCAWVVCAGCRATDTAGPVGSEIREVEVTVPAGIRGGLEAGWTVSWLGGMGPFTVTFDLGGGNVEGMLNLPAATSPLTHTVVMVNLSATATATNPYTVTIADSLGATGTASGTYQVGPRPNEPPIIEDASYDHATGVLEVLVSDPDDHALTVVLDLPEEVAADRGSAETAGPWPAVVSFEVWPVDLVAGGAGEWTLIVTDEAGESDSATVTVVVPGFTLVPDTLYAIPLRTHAAVDEPIVVVVATGPIAEDKPFQFLNGVGLVVARAGYQVGNSFNAGIPGGYRYDVDGFWEAMDPSGTFLAPPDFYMERSDMGGGRWRWDFNLTPIGGSDVAGVSGVLFNIAFEFDLLGNYELGFQEYFGVDRTYYSDGESNVYYWGDITNDHPPIPNSITVTAQ